MKMPPISFRNLADLENAQINFKELSKEGSLEIDGHNYKITVRSDGGVSASSSKADKFFSSLADKFSSAKKKPEQLAGKSQSQVISQILENKRKVMASVISQEIAQRDGDMKMQLHSAVRWAERSAQQSDPKSIYKSYTNELEEKFPMSAAQASSLFDALKKADLRVKIQHQSFDSDPDAFNLSSFLKFEPEIARSGFYRFNPTLERDAPPTSRITINIKPEYASKLLDVLIALMRKHSEIKEGKIAGPELFGVRTDSAIVYLTSDYFTGLKVAKAISNSIPEEAMISHVPSCMHRISTGLSYSENLPGDNTSHGVSRSELISKALTMKGGGTLEEKIAQRFSAAGYHSNFLAFRKESIEQV